MPEPKVIAVLESKPVEVPAETRASERKQARAAIRKRWDNYEAMKSYWDELPIEEAKKRIKELREELELAGRVLQQKTVGNRRKSVCFVCGRSIDNGYPAQRSTVRDPNTGLLENRDWCSAECVANTNLKAQGQPLPMVNALVK